jgi:hypothetical protein
MYKKAVFFIILCYIYSMVYSQQGDSNSGRYDWMKDPNDPFMQMFRESQRRVQEEEARNPRKISDLDPPPMWGGSPIEGCFVLFSKFDNRDTVLDRNSHRGVKFTKFNFGSYTVDRFVDGDKRVDFYFGGRNGTISSVEMVFENRTLEEFIKICNDTQISYGSALSVIYENPYFATGNNIGTIGVANAKYNVWGMDGWTIEVEYVTRTIPIAGEYSGTLKIKESKNIVIGR